MPLAHLQQRSLFGVHMVYMRLERGENGNPHHSHQGHVHDSAANYTTANRPDAKSITNQPNTGTTPVAAGSYRGNCRRGRRRSRRLGFDG
ncbi:hypothetical protein MAC_02961 [Metarhizium acridum CQMa 102]|uniref:Uncharacterized protein n=1 Tax=Metarhizium acridum (strain CQMa 102) TaxID=655827 RepID=E9DZB3_METAQ|nr:uncharacterized protein MAC_02961 [Metarhizium acridum CQMa 102]EFY91075.1 hypothetical protein MAC_02961 [Metarhizium acridum CQMa 102]